MLKCYTNSETVILFSRCFHNFNNNKITTEIKTTNNRAKPKPTAPFCLIYCQIPSIHIFLFYTYSCALGQYGDLTKSYLI